MKKLKFLIFILFILLLSSCIEPSLDQLVISLNPSVDTIEIHSEYIDQGATATYSFIDLDVEVITNEVDTSTLGTYEIVYKATYKSVSKELTRIVTVVDETAPILELNAGVDTLVLGEPWIDFGITAIDNSGQLPIIEVIGNVNHNEVGIYIITYTATDASGNQSSIKRYVEVIDINSIDSN